MPDHLRLISLEMRSPAFGAQTWSQQDQSIYGRHGGYDNSLFPGVSERVSFTYTWRECLQITNKTANGWTITTTTEEIGPVLTARVSTVRCPLPTGLAAVAGDGQVVLSWDPIAWNPEDWAQGPFLVVLRSDEQHAAVKAGTLSLSATQEIVRTNASQAAYVDRDVKNGAVYFYTLAVDGVTRATNWCRDTGEHEILVPIHFEFTTDALNRPVTALPGPPHPLRVALFAESTDEPRAHFVQAEMLRVLSEAPWVELVERSSVAPLLEERRVAELQTAAAQRALPADLVLRCRTRRVGYEMHLDVWMEDYRNCRRERLLSVSLDHLNIRIATEKLMQEIARRFPVQNRDGGRSNTPPSQPMRTIVIAGFLPLSPESQRRLPEGRDLDGLLIAATPADSSVRVVEREKVSAALKELGLGGGLSAESSLRLGQLLQADGLVTGFYGVDGEQLLLSARLIDVNSGRLVRTMEVQGALTNLSQIGRQIADGITSSATRPQGRDVGVLARWLEAQAYTSSRQGLGRAEAQAYVSPETPAHLFDVGSNHQAGGDLEQALSSFEYGLTVAEKQENPWRFYEAIGGLLKMLKRPQEEVDLWKRAVIDRQQRHLDADGAYLHLAQAQYTSGRLADALNCLQEVKGGSFEKGRLLEQLNLPVEAAKAYAASATNHASYAALIRLFETAAPGQKAGLLKVGVGVFLPKRPYQTIKAVDQLRALGQDDASLQLIGAQAAAAVARDSAATGKCNAEFKGENFDFDITESGLIICKEAGSHRVLWQYSLHPSAPYSRYYEGLMSWHGLDLLWSVRDLNVLGSSGVVDGDLLLISNVRDGVLHAIDCRTGQRLWQHLDWARISAPLVLGDRVYVGDSVGDLLVLSKITGELLRRVIHPSELESDCFERTPVLSFNDKKDAISFSNPSLFVTVNAGQTIRHPSHTVTLSNFSVALDPPLEIPRSRSRPASLVVFPGDERMPLADEEQQIVHEAEDVFARCQSGDSTALDEFKNMLRFGRSALHAIIAAGLVEKSMPEKQFVPHLTKNLHINHIMEIKRAYSRALAAIGDPSAIPALFVWLPEAPPASKDPFRPWREAETNPVVEALESLSGESFGADKGRWQLWWHTREVAQGRPK